MNMRKDATIRKSWADGYVADMTVTNDTGTPGPVTAIIEIEGTIRKHWGAEIEALEDGRYRVTFDAVAPGETVSGGFVVDGDAGGGVTFAADPGQGGEAPRDAPGNRVDPEEDRGVPDVPAPVRPGPEPHVTVSDDITADELQALIADSPAGTVIAMAPGTYRFDRTIEILRDDVSLLGASSDAVTIRVDGLGQEAFRVGHGTLSGEVALSRAADEGARAITLETADHGFEAGDFVYLERETTPDFLDSIGDRAWREDAPLRASIVEVQAVDGAELTLASGLHFDFDPSDTIVQEIDLVSDVTLGGFTVSYGLGRADPSDFSNTEDRYNRTAVIEVEGTSDLRLTDIVAHDVPSLGTNVALSRAVQADGLTMTGAHNKGAGGNGYALQIRDVYDSAFTGLNDMDMRHSVVFASWRSAVNNEVHVESTDRDINFHGGRDHGNVVRVDRSLRDAESDVISPTVFVNTEGTHYGAPTDADANIVTVRHAVGSARRDDITGDDRGSWLDGAGSHDILRGGAGDDVLIGGAGRDSLVGGAGEDVALYTGSIDDFRLVALGGDGHRLEVDDRAGDQHRDRVEEVEWLVFDDAAYRVSDGAILDRAGARGDLTPEAVLAHADRVTDLLDLGSGPHLAEDSFLF
ncbi:hypothetical protein [Roseivivax isoporae]|uniref:CBM2 domain-containing protein n=1 Tax=Roseivivax isoporae LMG 25204 TaxID=1449351 RepID=X7F1S4_9RHOB|nr:hypothetical protein [Roseivivax isoporae]ETX26867.1 hypothetical protein RISW2_18705 [Roseivivax isoporae LMG 25204]